MSEIDFRELKYIPTDYRALQDELEKISDQVLNAQSSTELMQLFDKANAIMEAPQTSYHIALIRSYTNINDSFYQDAFHTECEGRNALHSSRILSAFLSSPYFVALTNRHGKQLENRMRKLLLRAAIDPALLNTDRRLKMEFHKLRADVRIPFDNKVLTESEIYAYFNDPSRETRIAARKALSEAFYAERGRFSGILNELVRVRNGIASSAGFDSFLDYRDYYLERYRYGEKELTALCNDIRKWITPIYKQIQEYQKEDLGIERVTMCDSGALFRDGGSSLSSPAVSLSDAVHNTLSRYSPVLTSFFESLQENGYIDIRPSRNKVSGTIFTTDIIVPGYYPFIFANLKGATKSFNLLNCGIGTAYASYLISKKGYPNILRPTVTDAMEIPAKVLELISADYAETLCGYDADKFRYELFCQKIRELLTFCAYHDTETYMYTHPDASFSELAEKLHETLALYDPGHDDRELQGSHIREANLMRTVSIYVYPRYSISLVLSQIIAFELYDRIRKDSVFGWKDFDTICSYGGSNDYMDTLASVGMPTPFAPQAIKNLATFAQNELHRLRNRL